AKSEAPLKGDAGSLAAPWLRAMGLLHRVRREAGRFARALPLALMLTVAGKTSDLLSVWLLFVSFGTQVPVPLIMVTRCARALLAALPITADQTGLPHATELGLIHEATSME